MRLTCSIATKGWVCFGMNWSKNESTTTRTDNDSTVGAWNGVEVARAMCIPSVAPGGWRGGLGWVLGRYVPPLSRRLRGGGGEGVRTPPPPRGGGGGRRDGGGGGRVFP